MLVKVSKFLFQALSRFPNFRVVSHRCKFAADIQCQVFLFPHDMCFFHGHRLACTLYYYSCLVISVFHISKKKKKKIACIIYLLIFCAVKFQFFRAFYCFMQVGDQEEKLAEGIKLYAIPTTPTSKRTILSDLITVCLKYLAYTGIHLKM